MNLSAVMFFSMEVFEKNVVEICGKEISNETRC